MRLTAFTIENLRAIAGPLTMDGLGGIEVLHGENNARYLGPAHVGASYVKAQESCTEDGE